MVTDLEGIVVLMTRVAVIAWTNAYKRSWEDLDTDLFLSLFTEDAVYHPTPFSQPYRGSDLGRLWNTLKTIQKDNMIEFEVWNTEDDTAVARWDGESTRLPSMERNRGSGVFLLQFSKGKCCRLQQWQHWHPATAPAVAHIALIT
jgi:hypothetical protein